MKGVKKLKIFQKRRIIGFEKEAKGGRCWEGLIRQAELAFK